MRAFAVVPPFCPSIIPTRRCAGQEQSPGRALRRAAVATVLVLLLVPRCHADLIVSLDPSTNLSALTVGQTVGINVNVSGLTTSGLALDLLGATVQITPDSAQGTFTTPIISPGSAVPSSAGFTPSSSAGLADATYDDTSLLGGGPRSPVTQDGTFFSLTLTATRPGSGAFTLSSFTAIDTQGNFISNTSGSTSVNFQVRPMQQTPEPSAVVLAGLAAVALLARHKARRGRPRFTGLKRIVISS